MTARKWMLCALLILSTTSGCSLMPHGLQPAQLRKLNRGPALGRDATNFSIPDPEISRKSTQADPGADPFLR